MLNNDLVIYIFRKRVKIHWKLFLSAGIWGTVKVKFTEKKIFYAKSALLREDHRTVLSRYVAVAIISHLGEGGRARRLWESAWRDLPQGSYLLDQKPSGANGYHRRRYASVLTTRHLAALTVRVGRPGLVVRVLGKCRLLL